MDPGKEVSDPHRLTKSSRSARRRFDHSHEFTIFSEKAVGLECHAQ